MRAFSPAHQLLELAETYQRSKTRRVAAAYADTPVHLKHQVHQWFSVGRNAPKSYETFVDKIERGV